MGLDMYFYARKYIWGKSVPDADTPPTPDQILSRNIREVLNTPDFMTPKGVEFEVGYLRKANAIHGFIVENFADGKDECQDIYLYDEHLESLREVVEKVNSDINLAPTLLPATEGFFFGPQDYGEYYQEDIQTMLKILNNIDQIKDDYDLVYKASW